jgi:hypothetical protein
MSPITAACPGCGAAVEFRYDDSFVRVCAYCNAVVARGDRGFQSLGRMADLTVSDSPLALAVGGQVGAVGFQLIGRAQIAHARGGGWEEWYARFDNGTWGWLSEAQGRFQLSFSAGTPEGLPPFETLRPGQTVLLSLPDRPPETFTVSEIGEGTYRAAAGELPYQLVPGLRFRYADLSGDRGSTATIDAGVEAGEWVAFFVGREVSLADLGIQGGPSGAAGVAGAVATPADRAGQRVPAVQVACVQCGGALELRAPDRALRVTCGYCGALLDVDQGNLSYLRTLDREAQLMRPDIPLGSTVDLEDPPLTAIGCLRRSVHIDGIAYPFSEYLLYHPAHGYRWLVDSDNHWSYVTPLAAGDVSAASTGARHGGRRYRHFQTATARVDRVFGEFYWKVEPGETAQMTDYVSPPFMLSAEQAASEINWSRGVWMKADEVSRHVRPPGAEPGSLALPPAASVAPHQPFRHRGALPVAAILLALLIAAAIGIAARSPGRAIPLTFDPPLDATAAPTAPDLSSPLGPTAEGTPASRVHFSSPFELAGGHNVSLDFSTSLDNSWLYVAVDLVEEETGLTESFDVQLEWYHGVEGGESWTEGDREKNVTLGAVAAGRYVLRLETQWQSSKSSPPLRVAMRQGAFRVRYLMGALGLLVLPALLIGILWFSHEHRRWSESDHPWSSGGDE